MLGIFDSHSHYEDGRFDEDRDELLSSMSDRGVELIVNVGSSIDTTKKTIELIKKYPFVYGSAGVHPEECANLCDEDIDWLETVCADSKIVAVGEIGLDYYWPEPEHDIQKKWFRKQLDLAVKVEKPVIIHSRDAAKDTMDILKEYDGKLLAGNPGVIHCFSYSPEIADEYIKMGYYIGVGGVVTFNNAKKLKSVVSHIPMERMLIETDCPYMAPVPYRGKRNDSGYLSYVVDAIAEIKGIQRDEVIMITRNNAIKMYGIEV